MPCAASTRSPTPWWPRPAASWAICARAQDAGRLLPLSLAAEDSSQIGGNVATNAGGVNVVRYGMARELVLGLEAVLPTGEVCARCARTTPATTSSSS